MTGNRENSLIRRVKKKHDRRAADELINLYYREIYAYVYKQLGNKEESMDITQEIFLAMIQSIWSFDPDKASFRTWLYRIATYKTVDYFRSRVCKNEGRTLSLDYLRDDIEQQGKNLHRSESISETPLNPEQEAVNRAQAEEILKWLGNKEIILEEIFRLKFYGEYTFEEIGKVLEMPASTVKTKYYGGIRSVRKKMPEFMERGE